MLLIRLDLVVVRYLREALALGLVEIAFNVNVARDLVDQTLLRFVAVGAILDMDS